MIFQIKFTICGVAFLIGFYLMYKVTRIISTENKNMKYVFPSLRVTNYQSQKINKYNTLQKLELLKQEQYFGFDSKENSIQQQTCLQICKQIDETPKEYVHLLQPTGNLTKYPNLKITIKDVEDAVGPHLPGGSWFYKPSINKTKNENEQCRSVQKSGVAIIIVCNDRWKQLAVTLSTLIPLLQRQHLCYQIFVLEQAESGLLNKAKLLNIGFMEAIDRFRFDCVVFQDADLAPINDLNPYSCDADTKSQVIHLGVGIDVRKFKLNYPTLIGGVLKISNKHFLQVNGYSNLYWGWGQEDDDFEIRLKTYGIPYKHMDAKVARYIAVPHPSQSRSQIPKHIKLLKNAHQRLKYDGLSSLSYRIVNISKTSLFTYLLVSVK